MLIRHVLLSFCFCCITTGLSATLLIDSIKVENVNGKKVVVHKVEAKESYYSIGRRYQVAPQSIIRFNSNISLQPGSVIRVPTERPFEQSGSLIPLNNSDGEMAVVEYKVGPREYLHLIARKFNTTVEDLKKINNLSSDKLSVGQIIKVSYGTANQIVAAPAPDLQRNEIDRERPSQIDSSMNASERLKLPPARYGLREVDQRGLAVWISDDSFDNTKMLALHPTAPIGTVVKITNPMSGKSTFAKVVGKFALNEFTKDAIIVITKAAADLIGARDKRFQATIVYGVPNEY